MAFSKEDGKGVSIIHCLTFFPLIASAEVSSVFNVLSSLAIFSSSALWAKNSLNACAVVANPVGTRTPLA